MFRDYYAILDVKQNANQEEIKAAFKRQALKWHPDRNQGIDTTSKMQAINEAKLILLDTEAKIKYDIEYSAYHYQKQAKEQYKTEDTFNNRPFAEEWENFEDTEYRVQDEDLDRWMKNAKRQSVDLAKKTIEDFKGMVKAGAKAAANEVVNIFTTQIIIGVIILLFILFSKACNR